MIGKKEELWINNKGSNFSLKLEMKILLIFFNKDIEMFFQQRYGDVLISKCVIGSHLKLVHTHVRGSLRVQFPLYSYWFRPWLLS